MEHRTLHWLEKTQAQVVTLAALGLVFFIFWRAMVGVDPLAPITFIPLGQYALAGKFAMLVCILAVACAAVTFTSRPEGALLAAIIGSGGVSLHSPQIRALFWELPGQSGAIYAHLIAEVLFMAAALVAACVLIGMVRGLIGLAQPGWVWASPLSRRGDAGGNTEGGRKLGLGRLLLAAEPPTVSWPDRRGIYSPTLKGSPRQGLAQGLSCVGMSLLIAMILMQILLKSAERGQIIFALLASFSIGTLIGHQVFPTRYGLAVWAAPLAAAIVYYALASLSSVPASPIGWIKVPLYARALPIDWLSAGCGGAVLGYWISWRIHELRLMEMAANKE